MVLGLALLFARAQTPAPPNVEATNAITYPQVNLAPSYVVDPAWPDRPPAIPLGAVPGIAIDTNDNVWVYTRTNPAIQVYAPNGHYLFGWRAMRTNSAAHSIKFDRAGNLWLVDVGLHVVRQLTTAGQPLLTLGTEGEPGTDGNHFNKPTDVAIAPNGDIFVSDGYANSRVVHYDNKGKFINAWGTLGSKPGEFSLVHAIAVDAKGRVFVADRNNVRIQVFDARGKLLDVWQNILVPWTFWLSPANELWACGSSPMIWGADPKYPTAPLGCPPKDQLIVQFSPEGKVLQLLTFPKAADGFEKPGELTWLHCLAFDSKGNLYLGDIIGRRIQKFVRQ